MTAESQPEGVAERGDGDTAAANDGDAPPARAETVPDTEVDDQSFGWRGWVLVGALVISFLVIPWVIILLPRAQGFLASLGLGWQEAYLVLPMIPAIGLGVLAVWAAVASRRSA